MTSHLTVPVCEKGEIEECGALFFVTVEEARGDERAPQQGPHSPPRVHQPGRARHLSSSRSGCAQPMKTMLSAFSPISETSKTREVTHMANQLAGWRGSPRGDTRGTKKGAKRRTTGFSLRSCPCFFRTWRYQLAKQAWKPSERSCSRFLPCSGTTENN